MLSTSVWVSASYCYISSDEERTYGSVSGSSGCPSNLRGKTQGATDPRLLMAAVSHLTRAGSDPGIRLVRIGMDNRTKGRGARRALVETLDTSTMGLDSIWAFLSDKTWERSHCRLEHLPEK